MCSDKLNTPPHIWKFFSTVDLGKTSSPRQKCWSYVLYLAPMLGNCFQRGPQSGLLAKAFPVTMDFGHIWLKLHKPYSAVLGANCGSSTHLEPQVGDRRPGQRISGPFTERTSQIQLRVGINKTINVLIPINWFNLHLRVCGRLIAKHWAKFKFHISCVHCHLLTNHLIDIQKVKDSIVVPKSRNVDMGQILSGKLYMQHCRNYSAVFLFALGNKFSDTSHYLSSLEN